MISLLYRRLHYIISNEYYSVKRTKFINTKNGRSTASAVDHCCFYLNFRQSIESDLQFLIRGDVVMHISAVKGIVSLHIEISCTGKAKEYGLGFAALTAFYGLVDGRADRVGRLGGREDGFEL